MDQRAEVATAIAKTVGPTAVGGIVARFAWRQVMFSLAVLGSIGGATAVGVRFARVRTARLAVRAHAVAAATSDEVAPAGETSRADEKARDFAGAAAMESVAARMREGFEQRTQALRAYTDLSRMAQTWSRMGQETRPQHIDLPPIPSGSYEELMRLGEEQQRLEHWKLAVQAYVGAASQDNLDPRLHATALMAAADVTLDHLAQDEKGLTRARGLYEKARRMAGDDAELRARAEEGLARARAKPLASH